MMNMNDINETTNDFDKAEARKSRYRSNGHVTSTFSCAR